MSELMRLQKSRVITIQRCDKGRGLIILDTPEYIRAGEKHLTSSMRKGDGTEVNFYRKVDNDDLETAKKEILAVLDEALKANVITEDEYKHMNPMNDKKAARTYMLFKVHKAHQEGSAPPERPVISGSGLITENPSKFCQHYMKQVSKDHASFLRDR